MTSRLLVDKIEGKATSGTIQMPAGHIIQTVESQGVFSEVTTTGSSFVDSNMTLDITPKFANSFILCNFRCWCSCNQASGGIRLQVTRNGSNFEGGNLAVGEVSRTSGPSYWEEVLHIQVLDKTHNSTSALTYKVTLLSAGGTARVGVSNRTGTMIIQEIAQ
jgi:hypothetical protein